MANIEELEKAKEELLKVKESCDKSIETLVKLSKRKAVSFIIEAIVGGCAMTVVDGISKRYLPKNIAGFTKIGVASMCFIIPQILGTYAGAMTDKILEE